MEHIPNETPPADRRPRHDAVRTVLLIGVVLMMAVIVGGILSDPNYGRRLSGGIFIVACLFLFVIFRRPDGVAEQEAHEERIREDRRKNPSTAPRGNDEFKGL